jgi:hypothetical protein
LPGYRARIVRFRQKCTAAAPRIASPAANPIVGRSLAVFGRLVRVGRVVGAVGVVSLAVVATGALAGAWATPVVTAFGMARVDEAIVPSWVVPPGVAAVGFVSAFRFVSWPVDEILASSDVFVCAVVVVSACVVRTG